MRKFNSFVIVFALACVANAGAQTVSKPGQVGCIGRGRCQQQGQRQGQQQGQEATGGAASASASNGPQFNAQTSEQTSVSNNTSNYQTPVASAYTPAPFHLSPCLKGYGLTGQGKNGAGGLGIEVIDGGCQKGEDASQFENHGSDLAFCLMMVSKKEVRKAGVTVAICMQTRQLPAHTNEEINIDPPPTPQAAIIPPVIPVPDVYVTLSPWRQEGALAIDTPALAPRTVKKAVKAHRPTSRPCIVVG